MSCLTLSIKTSLYKHLLALFQISEDELDVFPEHWETSFDSQDWVRQIANVIQSGALQGRFLHLWAKRETNAVSAITLHALVYLPEWQQLLLFKTHLSVNGHYISLSSLIPEIKHEEILIYRRFGITPVGIPLSELQNTQFHVKPAAILAKERGEDFLSQGLNIHIDRILKRYSS